MQHPIDSRDRLIEAAIRVFAESGFRGATTRRIAEAAGVNEVTLFRLFKTKGALIDEAARRYVEQPHDYTLPDVPRRPLRELSAWCNSQLAFLRRSRSLIRKCMAELEEHPQMATCMRHGPSLCRRQLTDYAHALYRQAGLTDRGDRIGVACAMLNGVLFADAMGRDVNPDVYPQPERRAAAQYAGTFLRALGIAERAPVALHEVPANGSRHPRANGSAQSATRQNGRTRAGGKRSRSHPAA
jgi:AcrR family transcriptional regulator